MSTRSYGRSTIRFIRTRSAEFRSRELAAQKTGLARLEQELLSRLPNLKTSLLLRRLRAGWDDARIMQQVKRQLAIAAEEN